MIPLSQKGYFMFPLPLRLLASLLVCIPMTALAQTSTDSSGGTGKLPSINGKPIPKSRVDFIVKQRVAQGQPDNEQTRKAIVDNLVTQEVLAQEAERKGLGKSSD